MTSPDLTPYADLTIFDRDAEDIFEVFLTDVQSKIPEYDADPHETNTEMVLAQGMALEVAEEVFAINRLPSSTIEGVLRLFGVLRDEGAAPETTLTFQLGDTAGHSIPAGTRAALQLPNGLDPIVFSTNLELVVPPGASSATVAALGDRFTSEANGYAIATGLELLDSVSFVESVSLGTEPFNGRDAETQETWLSRGVNRFARLSETVSLPRHFVSFATDLGIFRAFAIDLYDPAQAGAPGDHPGHVTLAVYGRGDLPIPQITKDELLAALVPASAPHLIKHVVDPTVTPVDVTVTVARHSGYTDMTVLANCEEALRSYLSPDGWPWQPVVRRTQLISLLADVEGVAYVSSLTTPAADLALPGVANLTRPGAISVFVVPEGTV